MQELIQKLQRIGRDKHRYRVFEDFVTVSAITLHNQGTHFDQEREDEYLKIINTYDKADRFAIQECFALLVQALEPEPKDVLGGIFMSMELGDNDKGQFFTPDTISQLMANMQFANMTEMLKSKPFVTMSEPTCGAGGMVLAAVKHLTTQGYDPAKVLWVQAIDISRIAALMCYVQLSLWNVPAQVLVGNTLSMEMRESWYTPAHVWWGWKYKLKLQMQTQIQEQACKELVTAESVEPKLNSKHDNYSTLQIGVGQMGFDFG